MKQNTENSKKIRFGAVGLLNTGIDFALLFVLSSLGLSNIIANTVSTGIAFSFSFVAHRSYTFKQKTKITGKQIALFIAVTLAGLWGVQNLVMLATLGAIDHYGLSSHYDLLISKVIATAASLVWNYVLYSNVVFPQKNN